MGIQWGNVAQWVAATCAVGAITIAAIEKWPVIRQNVGWVVSAAAPTAPSAATTLPSRPVVEAPKITNCDRYAGAVGDIAYPGSFPHVSFADMDAKKAIDACKLAVAEGNDNPRFEFQLGRAYHKAGRVSEAIRWYRLAAEKGYVAAEANLGLILSRAGQLDEAREWLLKAKAGGDPDAMRFLQQVEGVQ